MKAGVAKVAPYLIGAALFFYVINQPRAAGAQVHGFLTWMGHVMQQLANFAGAIQ